MCPTAATFGALPSTKYLGPDFQSVCSFLHLERVLGQWARLLAGVGLSSKLPVYNTSQNGIAIPLVVTILVRQVHSYRVMKRPQPLENFSKLSTSHPLVSSLETTSK